MKVGDKEFSEMRNQFEKDFSVAPHYNDIRRIGKDEKVPKSVFYQDGLTNALFHAYMMGYENSKCLHRLDA
tara:strand:+ start:3210 stop:3422 length:213 start_codon:yes stop_codon:yes gene_type:complete